MAALLAARRALRPARPDLEHDDVDVRRLVLRGGVRGDHGWGYHGDIARDRLLRGAGYQGAKSPRDRLRHAGNVSGHPRLRSTAVSPGRGLGRQIPFRADCLGERTDVLDAGSVPPYAGLAGTDISVRGIQQGPLELADRAP